MRSLFLIAALAALAPRTHPSDWKEIRARAEKLFAEGSFELAHRAYDEAATLTLAPAEKRWLVFRLADTDWRSAAATDTPDTTRIERAKSALDALQKAVERPEEKDETWVDVEESLGDFDWVRRESQNLSAAMPHYKGALDWWAGAKDVERARGRWLAIAFRAAWPGRGDWTQNWWAGQIPIEVGTDAMRIAISDKDRAQAALLYALIVRQRGSDLAELQRGLEALESAIALGRETPWFDDALWMSAQWYETQGAPFVQEDGNWSQKPDYVKALALYRRIIAEFPKGRSRWRDQAESAIARILGPELSLAVPQAFLPGSEVGYQLSWRNLARVDLAVYAVDLTRAVAFGRGHRGQDDESVAQWLATIDLTRQEKLAGWSYDTKDTGEHRQGGVELRLETKLAPGAYVLEARSGKTTAREVVLVSSTSLVLKSNGDQALAWIVDASTSEPVGGADVAVWERSYDGGHWNWRVQHFTSGEDGTVLAKLAPRGNSEELFVAATKGDRAAFALGSTSWYGRPEEAWKIYAFTDRSTYRPGGRVEWKIVARTKKDGVYATPADAKLEYEILDPKGTSVGKGALTLNAFGSAWASFETKPELTLGEYRVSFVEVKPNGRRGIGGATLFRLEEYKLPEFEVRIAGAEAGGRKKLWRLGDRVEATVQADTYYGAPVANADVEVLVKQRPLWRPWMPEHDYPWLYQDESNRYGRNYGDGQIVSRLTLRTDAEGRAPFAFDTQKSAGQDAASRTRCRRTPRTPCTAPATTSSSLSRPRTPTPIPCRPRAASSSSAIAGSRSGSIPAARKCAVRTPSRRATAGPRSSAATRPRRSRPRPCAPTRTGRRRSPSPRPRTATTRRRGRVATTARARSRPRPSRGSRRGARRSSATTPAGSTSFSTRTRSRPARRLRSSSARPRATAGCSSASRARCSTPTRSSTSKAPRSS